MRRQSPSTPAPKISVPYAAASLSTRLQPIKTRLAPLSSTNNYRWSYILFTVKRRGITEIVSTVTHPAARIENTSSPRTNSV